MLSSILSGLKPPAGENIPRIVVCWLTWISRFLIKTFAYRIIKIDPEGVGDAPLKTGLVPTPGVPPVSLPIILRLLVITIFVSEYVPGKTIILSLATTAALVMAKVSVCQGVAA